MIAANITQLDDLVYLIDTTSDDTYLLLGYFQDHDHTLFIHLVELFDGHCGFFEFGQETYRATVWVRDAYWAEDMVYSLACMLLTQGVSLENPLLLYHSAGGYVPIPSEPMTLPYNLLS